MLIKGGLLRLTLGCQYHNYQRVWRLVRSVLSYSILGRIRQLVVRRLLLRLGTSLTNTKQVTVKGGGC